jgi:hypothetical protein
VINLETTIKNLISLQSCDLQVTIIRKRLEDAPARIKGLGEDLERLESQIDEELAKFDAIKLEKRKIDQEIEELEGKMAKSKNKLANIKSNKEYTAALKEIDDLGREKNRLEERALEILEELEAINVQSAESKEKKDSYRKEYEEDQRALNIELDALKNDLQKFEDDRTDICKRIDEPLLRQYDSIRNHKEGVGVSAVIKGVCQACHMGIPPQKFNELMRGDKLMNCPHCMRLIYWGEDERYLD